MKYKINKGFIVQKLADKAVIFDGEESMLYTFNETASYIFKKLKLGNNEKQITGALVKRYNITVVKAKNDIKDLITVLKKKKIITVLSPKKLNK